MGRIRRFSFSGHPQLSVITLAHARNRTAAVETPLEIINVDAPQAPAPDGLTHAQYGEALGVPGLDPMARSLDGLHLWHVVEDVDLLHRLLSLQITSWGQLKILLEHGGAGILQVEDAQYQRVYLMARAIESSVQAWRIGRGKTVNREVLLESGAVSEKFVDAISELAERVDGDAEVVIAGLQQKAVPKWRAAGTEKLQEYFEGNGYWVADDVLGVGDIRARVLAEMAGEISEGWFDIQGVDRAVGRLGLG